MDYIEDSYPQGNIVLGIDPEIWKKCCDEACVSEEDVKGAMHCVDVHLNILRNLLIGRQIDENQYVALALASFQVQLYYGLSANDERSYNEKLKSCLGVDNVIEEYYKRDGRYYGLTLQEMIFRNAQVMLGTKGYAIPFGKSIPIGKPNCYVQFPSSQSLNRLVGYSRKDPINFFAEKWVKDYRWTRNDSLNVGFRSLFDEKMKPHVRSKYGLYGNDPETDRKLSLVLNSLYGYFSNVWNGEYPDSETGRVENVQKNKYTIERLKIDGGRASFELWKNEEKKIDYIPKVVLYAEHKHNSVFLIDDRYEGYARLEKDALSLEKYKEEKCIILAPINGLQNLPENVEAYKVEEYGGCQLILINEINEAVVKEFNLKTGKPFFEFIGGVRVIRDSQVNRDSQKFVWFDFAIPKLKINSSKDKLFVDSQNDNFSIDGDELEKEIDLSNLKSDVEYRFHLENARKSVKFKIVSANHYPKGKTPENAGWIIGRNRIEVAQGLGKKNECRIKGLEGVNMDDDPCSPIMRHLKRFEFVKKTVENNQIEKRRKYVC